MSDVVKCNTEANRGLFQQRREYAKEAWKLAELIEVVKMSKLQSLMCLKELRRQLEVCRKEIAKIDEVLWRAEGEQTGTAKD